MTGGRTKLTARAAATMKPGRYGDGGGLYLVVSPSRARKWLYRFTYAPHLADDLDGSRRERNAEGLCSRSLSDSFEPLSNVVYREG